MLVKDQAKPYAHQMVRTDSRARKMDEFLSSSSLSSKAADSTDTQPGVLEGPTTVTDESPSIVASSDTSEKEVDRYLSRFPYYVKFFSYFPQFNFILYVIQ